MKLLMYEIYQLNFEISLLFIILPVNKQIILHRYDISKDVLKQ